MQLSNTGILLTNIGSPNQPTPTAVKKYLKEFLSDPRVVEFPRALWWLILHGFILRTRPQKSAKLYQKIWTQEGSPLLIHTQKIAQQLQDKLHIPVVVGMHYGQPSIQSALENLRAQKIKKILILPLYPQYSATTTASTFDKVNHILKTWRDVPEIRTIHDYHSDENYIAALCHSIQKQQHIDHLIFSFHGIPMHYINQGDPYAEQCQQTAQLVTQQLKLPSTAWSICYQSRIGRTQWMTPYTDQLLKELPQKGIKNIHVICPGFAVDCLETLEEIAIRGKEQFLNAGGKTFHYIPALNENAIHIDFLEKIILKHIQGW